MSSKGQLTVPAAVREALGLRDGDVVDFYVAPGSRNVRFVARNLELEALRGSTPLPERAAARTPEEMDAVVGAAVAEDDARIMREAREWEAFRRWKAGRAAG